MMLVINARSCEKSCILRVQSSLAQTLLQAPLPTTLTYVPCLCLSLWARALRGLQNRYVCLGSC